MTFALETDHLGKRYGQRWTIHDSVIQIPTGRVVALVGPNGAGKTTLLHLAVGLLRPTTGSVRIAGYSPTSEPAQALARIGFVAQDHPMYRGYTVAEMFTLGRRMNVNWDQALAEGRMRQVDIPLNQRVGKLSGGQQAQVALALALAKHPQILLLDEPVASLDPLARRDFLRTLMDAVALGGLTIVLSSHLIADLERVCDYLIVLTSGRVRLAGEIETLLCEHAHLTGPREAVAALASLHTIIAKEETIRHASLIVRTHGPILDPVWESHPVSLETLVIGYMEQGMAPRDLPSLPQLEVVR